MPKVEQFLNDVASGFIEPVGRKSAYRDSRLAVLRTGGTLPVLMLLAQKKYGTWTEDKFPYWLDGDRTNETLANVGLATRAARRRTRPRLTNRYGAPAGSREYMKNWRVENRDKIRAAQARYNAKRREAVKALEARGSESFEDPILKKLEDLIGDGE